MLLQKEGRHATTTDYCGINDDGAGREGRTTIINKRDRELVRKFEEISRSHEGNMSSGYSRQVPKRRLLPPPLSLCRHKGSKPNFQRQWSGFKLSLLVGRMMDFLVKNAMFLSRS